MSYMQWVQALYFWQYDPEANGTFVASMISAYRSADTINKIHIAEAFPNLFKAMNDWEESRDYGNDLFRELGIGRFSK